MFEKVQELLKKVYDRKNILVGGSWSLGKDLWIIQEEKQSFCQQSFLSNDWIGSQVSSNYQVVMIDENVNLNWTIFVENFVSFVGDKTVEEKIKLILYTIKSFLGCCIYSLIIIPTTFW